MNDVPEVLSRRGASHPRGRRGGKSASARAACHFGWTAHMARMRAGHVFELSFLTPVRCVASSTVPPRITLTGVERFPQPLRSRCPPTTSSTNNWHSSILRTDMPSAYEGFSCQRVQCCIDEWSKGQRKGTSGNPS
jgi:hypothetical protein